MVHESSPVRILEYWIRGPVHKSSPVHGSKFRDILQGLTKTRTGPDHRTTINFCARSQKCACALDCKDLPALDFPKRYQGNTVTIQRNDQTCVLAASHAAYAISCLLPYVNEHIQGQKMTKEDIEKTLPGPCTYHYTVFHHTHLTGAVFSFLFHSYLLVPLQLIQT